MTKTARKKRPVENPTCAHCQSGCPNCKPLTSGQISTGHQWYRVEPPQGIPRYLQDNRHWAVKLFASKDWKLIFCKACKVPMLCVRSLACVGEGLKELSEQDKKKLEIPGTDPYSVAQRKLVRRSHFVDRWCCPASLTCSKSMDGDGTLGVMFEMTLAWCTEKRDIRPTLTRLKADRLLVDLAIFHATFNQGPEFIPAPLWEVRG